MYIYSCFLDRMVAMKAYMFSNPIEPLLRSVWAMKAIKLSGRKLCLAALATSPGPTRQKTWAWLPLDSASALALAHAGRDGSSAQRVLFSKRLSNSKIVSHSIRKVLQNCGLAQICLLTSSARRYFTEGPAPPMNDLGDKTQAPCMQAANVINGLLGLLGTAAKNTSAKWASRAIDPPKARSLLNNVSLQTISLSTKKLLPHKSASLGGVEVVRAQ